MSSAHRHRDLEINYVLAGTMTYLVGGRIVELPPHRLCLLWGGVPHQMIRSATPAEAVWITIPLAVVLRWGLPDRLIRPLLTLGLVADAAPRSGDWELLQQWLRDLPGRGGDQRLRSRADSEGAGIVLLEIEARLRRLAHGLAALRAANEAREIETHGGDRAAHGDHGLTAVEAMAQFIARNFADSVGIKEIAEAAHLHPNYAMTLFRRHTGMTLLQYLVLQRVADAQRRLATTSDTVQAIALDSGFGSVSRFYEAFRAQTGASPRRFRLQITAPRSGD